MTRSTDLLLGFDLGTSYFKACVFDRKSGRPLSHAGMRRPVRGLDNGGREQDIDAIRQVLNRLVRQLRKDLTGDWSRIAGIGVASQGGSTIIVSRDGVPLTPMLLWNDARAHAQFETVLKLLPLSFWKKLTLREVPADGMARILWLQQHRPELFKGKHDNMLHVGAGDYLYFLLTGVWRQEAGSAIQIGPYDAKKKRLDARPLKAFGLSLDFVPPLRQGHDTSPLSASGAAALRLPAGVPVVGPYIDQEAGYRAAVTAVEAPLQISLGTAWVGNFQIAETKAGDAPFQLVLPADTPEQRLVVLPLLTGNATWEWALREFAGGIDAKALTKATNMLNARPFPHLGLYLLPWNSQGNPLVRGAYGGGAFVGMNPSTTREDFLSATAACLAFELGRVFGNLRTGGIIKNVVLSGGASNGEHFRKLLATLMAPIPVWRGDGDREGARGALYAFDMKSPRDALVRVPLPGASFQKEAKRRAGEYEMLLDKLYGHVKAGRKYTLK